MVGLKGCVKGFQFQKKDFNLLEENGTIGISSGCPEESFVSTPCTTLHTASDNKLHYICLCGINTKYGWWVDGTQNLTNTHLHTQTFTLKHERIIGWYSWMTITWINWYSEDLLTLKGKWKVMSDVSEMCFYCDRCPVKPISPERATWDPQQRFHSSTVLKEVSTLKPCSPMDSCSTTVKGYIHIFTPWKKFHKINFQMQVIKNYWWDKTIYF